MTIELQPVAKNDKSVLRNLLELYSYDFSEFLQYEITEHGLFNYPHVDAYWSEPGRYPLFVRVEGNLAGFVLINQDAKVPEASSDYVMAEFFVLRRYRRLGIGREVVQQVLTRFPGKWEISVVQANPPASEFWARVIQHYTQGEFRVVDQEIKELPRRIYLFQTRLPFSPPVG